ncbi:MAG: adenine deaminase [Phascolarctobacterium sp.]
MRELLRAVALGKQPADLLIKNAKIVDVLTESVYEAEVVVAEGYIAAVAANGTYKDAKKVLDIKGAYLAPGLINAHCHVESSMAAPQQYCLEELRWGVTTLITDPHEIANVAGAVGIRYMLHSGQEMPINYYVELPSCVPATPFEHAGCVMDADVCADLMHEDGILGLGEMMNVPGVLNNDPSVLSKLQLFLDEQRVIDGHAPMLGGKELQAYAASGINTDHESISWSEAKAKLRAGLAVLVREGSASRNLTTIIQGVIEDGVDISNMAFCTDDKHLADIRKEGTIRHCVQMAIALGMEPVRALRMASINAARIYGLKNIGAVAPGWQADLVVFDNLESLKPLHVFHKGEDAVALGETVNFTPAPAALAGSVHPAPFTEDAFAISRFATDKLYPVIQMLEGEIFTERGEMHGSEVAEALAAGRVHLIAVIERHNGTGNIGLGLLQGYGLRNGAAATTVAHDSHNLIVIGSSPADMFIATQELIRVQGGYTLVKEGKVVGTVPLDIGGLMSSLSTEELANSLDDIKIKAHAQGVPQGVDPFISLSFMALPVIPRLRITDMGMFDVDKFAFCE